MAYKIQVIDMSCCESAINPEKVEGVANRMQPQGYDLVQVYVDTTMSCCGNKKSLIMIFRKQ